MKRRLFIQSALGAFFIPAAGELFAKTPVIADIELPKPENVISKFGFVTDVHYVVAPTRLIPKEDSVRVYRDSLAKLRQAIDLFNGQNLDFAIELGDFKDCNDNGTREGTIARLQTVEAEFRRFNGPRYHVAGNHDFDKITYGDFVSNITNHGDANGRMYYSLVSGGVKYIVLDACYNNAEGDHYALGKFDWTKAVVPDAEVEWLKKELASGKEPVIVFTLEKSGRVLAVLSGHYHKGYYSRRNGIHYVVNQGMVERPLPHNVLGIVSVDRDHNVYVQGIYDERSHVCKKA